MTTEEMDNLQASLSKECERMYVELGLDGIQIVATFISQDGTTSKLSAGSGNFYARLGATREWCLCQDEFAKEYARQQVILDDEENMDG